MQFEIRRKKPTTTKQFLEYAKKIEEFFQLSNINTAAINTNHNSGIPTTSAITRTNIISLNTNYKCSSTI
ncbi:unnamed protein product [Rotaria sp. Silwood2]|nr:unnamed protein product [Rotaria sp. Silwood2]